MKFSDGGCRPGFNVQFATDTATGIVLGVDVTNAGTDSEQMPPMLDQLETRYDTVPGEMLVDGGFASLDAIDATEARDCKVYAPVKDAEKQKKAGKDPYARKPHDTDHMAAWRERMGQEASRTIYKPRPDSGMGQCVVPQPRILADAGAWSREMPDRGDAVRDHT